MGSEEVLFGILLFPDIPPEIVSPPAFPPVDPPDTPPALSPPPEAPVPPETTPVFPLPPDTTPTLVLPPVESPVLPPDTASEPPVLPPDNPGPKLLLLPVEPVPTLPVLLSDEEFDALPLPALLFPTVVPLVLPTLSFLTLVLSLPSDETGSASDTTLPSSFIVIISVLLLSTFTETDLDELITDPSDPLARLSFRSALASNSTGTLVVTELLFAEAVISTSALALPVTSMVVFLLRLTLTSAPEDTSSLTLADFLLQTRSLIVAFLATDIFAFAADAVSFDIFLLEASLKIVFLSFRVILLPEVFSVNVPHASNVIDFKADLFTIFALDAFITSFLFLAVFIDGIVTVPLVLLVKTIVSELLFLSSATSFFLVLTLTDLVEALTGTVPSTIVKTKSTANILKTKPCKIILCFFILFLLPFLTFLFLLFGYIVVCSYYNK